ncbi:MAG TPA: hypothetical protein VN408_11095 [Actinoplanes sp.]|nr:hypothetical protein [Actinoplanes sp.]
MSTAIDPGAIEVTYHDLMNEINSTLDEIQAEINNLAADLSMTMRLLPLPVAWAIGKTWDKFLEVNNEIFDEVQKYLAEPGMPQALWRIGEYWGTQVGVPVSSLHQEASAFGKDADNRWTGSAVSAYADSAEAQSRALATISPLTDRIQNALDQMAWGLIAFWVAFVSAFATFLVGIVSSGILAATIAGAPIAAADALATAGVVLGLLTAAVAAVLAYGQQVDETLTSCRQALRDNTGLVDQGGGVFGWPRLNSMAYDGTGSWKVAD